MLFVLFVTQLLYVVHPSPLSRVSGLLPLEQTLFYTFSFVSFSVSLSPFPFFLYMYPFILRLFVFFLLCLLILYSVFIFLLFAKFIVLNNKPLREKVKLLLDTRFLRRHEKEMCYFILDRVVFCRCFNVSGKHRTSIFRVGNNLPYNTFNYFEGMLGSIDTQLLTPSQTGRFVLPSDQG